MSTVHHVSALRSWHADIEREHQRAQAEAVLVVLDTGADGPAAKARETRAVEIEGRARGSTSSERIIATRVSCECHIETLCARGQITDAQRVAGMWFRGRYLLGYPRGAVTASYSERRPGNRDTPEAERVTDARADLLALAKLLSALEWAAVEGVAGCDEKAGGRVRWLCSGLDLVGAWREVGKAT